jgi:hypothetical protein
MQIPFIDEIIYSRSVDRNSDNKRWMGVTHPSILLALSKGKSGAELIQLI